MIVYDRAGEKLIIMDVREALVQPFDAAEWTDLRVGFMLSLTSASANDNISSLTANIADNGDGLQLTDRHWIGIKNSDDVFPGNPRTQFIGFTDISTPVHRNLGDSKLVTSDGGVGTSNANYYRPRNSRSPGAYMFSVFDGAVQRGSAGNGAQLHFIQNNTAAYATCVAFRLTRPDTRSNARQITVQVASGQRGLASSDLEYTANPSAIELQSQLANFPSLVQQFGPISMTEVPDTLFCYTPWTNSRLRIHAAGVYSVT